MSYPPVFPQSTVDNSFHVPLSTTKTADNVDKWGNYQQISTIYQQYHYFDKEMWIKILMLDKFYLSLHPYSID